MNKYTDEFLNSMRNVGDEEADKLISDWISQGEIYELKQIFQNLVYNKEIKFDKMPPAIEEYFEKNSVLPDFADLKKIEKAQNAFAKFGPSIILAYFTKSLPECYACGKGAKVLGITGRLNEHTRRRIAQTSQFVMDVMSPGGLESNGRGLASALKVRLVHASIRFYMQYSVDNKRIEYNYEEDGFPINQEDLAGTMLAFSIVVCQGVHKFGVYMSQEDKEAIFHLWQVVGHLIGISDEILPKSYKEAEFLWLRIRERHYEQTQDGIELNNSLIKMLEELIPFDSLDSIVYLLLNHQLDKKAREVLKVSKNYNLNLKTFVVGILLNLLIKVDNNGIFSKFFTNHVNLVLMDSLKSYVQEGENIEILVPPGLHKDWNDNHIKSKKLVGVLNVKSN